MWLCGRHSIAEAVLSIAIGDMIFSFSSICVHLAEILIFKGGLTNSKDTTLPIDFITDKGNQSVIHIHNFTEPESEFISHGGNVTHALEELKIIPEFTQESRQAAQSILCWTYFTVNGVNLVMSLVLYQAVLKENILKCITYLVTFPFLILTGIALSSYHIFVLGLQPFYYGGTVYPLYWLYKVASLLIVGSFLTEIRKSPKERRRKKREEYFQLGGSSLNVNLNPVSIRLSDVSMESFLSAGQQALPVQEEADLLLPRSFEIPSQKLKIDHTTCLGTDEHHSILRGILRIDSDSEESGSFMDVEVAVKTLKVTTPTIPFSTLLRKEAGLLAWLGDHEGIVRFIGLCAKEEMKEKLFLVMEFNKYGSLSDFLTMSKESHGLENFTDLITIEDKIPVMKERKEQELPNFDTISLIQWSLQVASGMEFLHRKRVIHGTLDTTCVLLVDPSLVKISNFSFARKLLSDNYTVRREEFPNRFPWRSSALECLSVISSDAIKFTSRTDVWSFGIFMWELFTLGETTPYGEWNTDIVKSLMNGLRLGKPTYATHELYDIISACWEQDPIDRPKFTLIKLFLQQILSSVHH